VALGPEQVEEEGGPEDSGDIDANEDVEGGDADEVVVVNIGGGILLGEEVLLVDVVYTMSEVYQRLVSRDGTCLIVRRFLNFRSRHTRSWRAGR
jgi:hypothetical protein